MSDKEKKKLYIDLNGKGDDSIFIEGLDDPEEWKAKQEALQSRGGGCCAGPQPIQNENFNEQNLEKLYKDAEESFKEEETNSPVVEFVEETPQKRETVEISEPVETPKLQDYTQETNKKNDI